MGFFLFNASYFFKQIRYLLHPPTVEKDEVIRASTPAGIPKPTCLPADHIRIPSLDIDAPIVYVSGTTESLFQKALENGVVHLPGSAKPGESGNTYLFGHSSDYPWKAGGYKTVFALLPKIMPNDAIYISDSEGREFFYRVTDTLIVAPDDLRVLDQHDGNVHMLTLQTSYPLGTALRRFIVQTELQEQVECDPAG